ncbi:hypothetical protein PCANC_18246 [Puccinia coronata f. sp. avenae]|uniref:Uncharacterized protein n=2 Tax=Puccinia coronata f. sp. avenae TaxID=200324 RepID=A0A2N5UQY0_9BASI|nr:hypothetical protein PCASD_19532 [Puccinia coronata f. sp. avenae]PLW36051.1 hypothetical protein PCASD_16315 [Puccinia coronata f. sp. avenae]PLW40152.1 hypothetical protein PCANC_18246 [Puccinia coronata f. sp. avenae]
MGQSPASPSLPHPSGSPVLLLSGTTTLSAKPATTHQLPNLSVTEFKQTLCDGFILIQELGPPPKRKKGPNSSPEEKAKRDPPPHSSDKQPSNPTISTGNTPRSNTTQDSTQDNTSAPSLLT